MPVRPVRLEPGGKEGDGVTKVVVEVCNKNIQAHSSDIRAGIPAQLFLEKSIVDLAQLRASEVEGLGRLALPLYKAPGDTHYQIISYDRAIERCVVALKAAPPERSFFYASGRSSNEAAFLLQLFARLYGTNNVNNCSYYCHQASGAALNSSIGTGTATVRYDDLEQADMIFVIGANPASNHPRYLKCLLKCRRRGGEVVVINPAREAGLERFASPSDWRSMLRGGEQVASLYVQPHLGGDLALFHGIAKAVLELGAEDRSFIENHCEHFQSFHDQIHNLTWSDIERDSGVSKSEIEALAQRYARAKNVIFSWSMGLTHHLHGVENIQALVSLALLRGMVGRPGAGLLPLRGHSNIQGTGSMGFTPALKQGVEQALEAKLDQSLPKHRGLDTMSCMRAADSGDMDVAVMLGGNLLASNPDTKFAERALANIPTKIFFNTTLNASHLHAVDEEVIVLPVRARDEESQCTTQESMFNFVRLSEGGIERFPQLRSEADLIVSFGEALIDKERFDFSIFRNLERVRAFISEVLPGFSKLSKIDSSREEFHIDGRTLHEPVFATPTNKASFSFHCARPREQGEWLLSSVRSEGQFNSIIYHEFDSYREQKHRWVLMMHPDDIRTRGWKEGDRVDVTNDTGKMQALELVGFDVRRGNALCYYPEANALVPAHVAEKSGTPGFKSVSVKIERSAS
jgi:molybdopterin-dependent oxidoreductase alpha subunit